MTVRTSREPETRAAETETASTPSPAKGVGRSPRTRDAGAGDFLVAELGRVARPKSPRVSGGSPFADERSVFATSSSRGFG